MTRSNRTEASISPHQIHPELIDEARGWVSDCQWTEDPETLADCSDTEIVRGVHRHYEGGWAQFTQDVRGWSREGGWGPLPGSVAWKQVSEEAAR